MSFEIKQAEGRYIEPKKLREFSAQATTMWLVMCAREWSIVFLCWWVCATIPHPAVWIAAIMLIGTRQHGFGILAHEGTHFLVHRKRWINDLLGNFFTAWALSYTVEGYRANHLKHHRTLETPEDPEQTGRNLYPDDWNFPMTKGHFYWMHFRDSLGLSSLNAQSKELVKYIWNVPKDKLAFHIFKVAVFQLMMLFVTWAIFDSPYIYLLLWLVPLYTVATAAFRFRTVAEHSALGVPRYSLEKQDTLLTTRTTRGGLVGSFLFAPFNMNYHIEHHMYPSVPVWRLKHMHYYMLASNEAYAKRANTANGYPDLVAQLTDMSNPTPEAMPSPAK